MSDAAADRQALPNPRRGLIGYLAHNHVAANVLMLGILGGGLFALSRLPFERFPEFDPRTISVTVPYPGATPHEVEEDITDRIVGAVFGLPGVERVVSNVVEGSGTVTLELETLARVADVLNDVRMVVGRIENFPPLDAEQPRVMQTEVMKPVLTLAVTSSVLDEHALRLAAETLRDDLLALPGVSVVSLVGSREREIHIELSEEALRYYNLTIHELAQTVRRSSINLSSGELRTEGGDVVVSVLQKRLTAAEFEDIVLLARPDGSLVRLRDAANVRDGFVDRELINEIDGRPAVFVKVSATTGQSGDEVSEEVLAFLGDYRPPPAADIALWQNERVITRAWMARLAGNAIMGALLVFVTLLLIFDLRMALWISMGIPISVIGAFTLFGVFNLSINVLVVFAIFVVIGIVVDDAIVVGESIAKSRESGLVGATASVAGVRSVGAPVAVGAITTMITFFALYPMDEAYAQLFRVVPVVVALVLAASLVEAFCILPAHLSGVRAWSRAPLLAIQSRVGRAFDGFVNGPLMRSVGWAVRRPFVIVAAIGIAFGIAVVVLAVGALPYNTFPASIGGDRMQVDLRMPVGTRFEATSAAAEHLAEAARAANADAGGGAVAAIAVTVGEHRPRALYEDAEDAMLGEHLATVQVRFHPDPLRTVSEAEYERLWRGRVGTVPGAEAVTFATSAARFAPSLSHSLIHDDMDTVGQAVDDLRNAYAEMDAVYQVNDTFQLGKRRFELELTRAGAAAGLTEASVAAQLRDSFFGREVQRVQRGADVVKVMVRYPGERRRSLADLFDERIFLPGGGEAPLPMVVRITEVQDPASLLSINGRPAATVTAFYDAGVTDLRGMTATVAGATLPALQARYPGLDIDEEGSTRDASAILSTLSWSFPLALAILYALMAMLLRSFGMPLLALAGVPMAVVGAVVGHAVLGYDLLFSSLFGLAAVSGVVLNDTLVLLHRYNQIRAADPDLPAIAAVVSATRQRARAIVLTTITTFIGLAPMLLDRSELLEFVVPMVVSIAFGLLFASLGLLFLLPAVLMIIEISRSALSQYRFAGVEAP